MFKRTLFSDILKHQKVKQVTVITGLRRVGKTTTLKYLLDQVGHDNKLYLDLERVEHRSLFIKERYDETEQAFRLLGINLKEPCVIALDEIQLLPQVVNLVKYFYDHHEVKFIVTGSSSFYLKNQFSESLAGRKKIFELYPLSFPEFIDFKGLKKSDLEENRVKPFSDATSFYTVFKALYDEYLRFGGFPEVVLSNDYRQKDDLLLDILNSYIDLDVKILADFSLNDELYRLIRLLATRVGSRVDYQKLSSLTGINRAKIKDLIHLFEKTYLLHIIHPFSYNVDREISGQPKMYFTDSGLLRILGVEDMAKCFENSILCQLRPLGEVNYYQRKTGQDIDFIFDKKKAIEVKLTPSAGDVRKLGKLAGSIGIDDRTLVALHPSPVGFNDFVWGGNIY